MRPCRRRADPKSVTLEEAGEWIDAKAAQGRRRRRARRSRRGRRSPRPSRSGSSDLSAGGSFASRGLPSNRNRLPATSSPIPTIARSAISAAKLPTVAVSAPSTPARRKCRNRRVESVADEAAIAGLVRLPAAEEGRPGPETAQRRRNERNAKAQSACRRPTSRVAKLSQPSMTRSWPSNRVPRHCRRSVVRGLPSTSRSG